MRIYTVESLSGRRIKEGELIYANGVLAANLLRDVREAIQNAIGGKMRRYEGVLDRVTAQAIETLKGEGGGGGLRRRDRGSHFEPLHDRGQRLHYGLWDGLQLHRG